MVTGQDSAPEEASSLERPTLRRRLIAALLDLPIFIAWIAFTTVLGQVIAWLGVAPSSPEGWDAYAFATLIVPIALTFALLEASPRQATMGKRHQGLKVVDRHGRRLTLGRSLLRQALKLFPWQMAHTAVFQLASGITSPLIWCLAIGAQLLVLVSALLMIALRPPLPLHDRLVQTRVVDGRWDSPKKVDTDPMRT